MPNDFDDDVDDEDEGDVEQVCEVVCPHCKKSIHVIVAAADHDSLSDEDEL